MRPVKQFVVGLPNRPWYRTTKPMPNQEQLEILPDRSEDRADPVARPHPWWMALIATVAFLLWFILKWYKVSDIDALFAGLALAALWFTIFQQNADLRIQSVILQETRHELKLTREEVKGQREALEKQVRMMTTQFHFAVWSNAPRLAFEKTKEKSTDNGNTDVYYRFINRGGLAQELNAMSVADDLLSVALEPKSLDSGEQGRIVIQVLSTFKGIAPFVITCTTGNDQRIRFDCELRRSDWKILVNRRSVEE